MRQATSYRDPEGATPVVRLFPLTGSLLLPGVYLPLNVFEPRYRTMVSDALEDDRRIGMIQPRLPAPDHRGPVAGAPPAPELYSVGCWGEMVECEPQADGRFLIVLEGICRFRALHELSEKDGYRRVTATFDEFRDDLESANEDLGVALLLGAVGRFGERYELDLDLDLLASLPGARLVNALSASLPFGPGERQALLEAPTGRERRDLLLQLLTIGLEARERIDPYEPPPVH